MIFYVLLVILNNKEIVYISDSVVDDCEGHITSDILTDSPSVKAPVIYCLHARLLKQLLLFAAVSAQIVYGWTDVLLN